MRFISMTLTYVIKDSSDNKNKKKGFLNNKEKVPCGYKHAHGGRVFSAWL